MDEYDGFLTLTQQSPRVDFRSNITLLHKSAYNKKRHRCYRQTDIVDALT